jgi:hypothetical protein
MKRILLLIGLILPVLAVNAQSIDAEKQFVNTQISSGKLPPGLVSELGKKWNTFIAEYTYPVLPLNSVTGEVDFTDILTIDNMAKKTIFQRCLQWVALNYHELVYQDFESGKIIANGALNLNHTCETRVAYKNTISTTQTWTNYTLVLTVKDNKIKYNVVNIDYKFSNYSEIIDEISMPMLSLFPIVNNDPLQWERYTSVLKATNDVFGAEQKKAILEYVKNAGDDDKF